MQNIKLANKPYLIALNKNLDLLYKIAGYFDKMIKPYYGNQSKSLQKIFAAKDRECKILCNDQEDVGLVIYKTSLINEYTHLNISDAIEIKTLFVINPELNSGKGYASLLLSVVINYAKSKKAKFIFVTVSEGKKEAFQFFMKKGFQIKELFTRHYVEGYDEYLLYLKDF